MHSNDIRSVADRLLGVVKERYDRGGVDLLGIPTGYTLVDAHTGGMQPDQLWLFGARTGGGKALDVGTPIPTPDGWTTMGELRVGDRVFDESGNVTTVTWVRDIYEDEVQYRVSFSDGSYLDACADHRWVTHDHRVRKSEHSARKCGRDTGRPVKRYGTDQSHKRAQPEVVTTQEIKDTLRVGTGVNERWNHAVRVALPLDLPEADLPIDPYTFGVWLGDGTSVNTNITTMDIEVVERVERAGYVVEPRSSETTGQATTYCVKTKGQWSRNEPNPVYLVLKALGVLGNKHIPQMFLRASYEQRLELLRGLMDTDGYVRPNGTCEITQKNETLAADIAELVASLGMQYRVRKKIPRCNGVPSDEVTTIWFAPNVDVCTIPRKKERLKKAYGPRQVYRYIVGVEPIERVPMRCITVDSPSHMYLAGRAMIPTHNTSAGLDVSLEAARFTPSRTVLFFSLEMSAEVLVNRLISRMTEVAAGRIIRGKLDEDEWRRVKLAAEELGDLNLHIIDSTATSTGITEHSCEVAERRDISLVTIDYIQLLKDPVKTSETERVGEISRNVRALARPDMLNCPVVGLSQLNRSSQTSEDRVPQLHHLKNSSNLEQDANIVLLFHRPALENRNKDAEPQAVENDAEIIIAKNREGLVCSTEAQFIPRLTKWKQ